MLSLISDIEDQTAVAVQRDLHSLEHHITVLQLRKSHHQTSITSFFQPRSLDFGTRGQGHQGTSGDIRGHQGTLADLGQ